MTQSTRREFKLAKTAIPMLIQSQAGTLEKAILEGVANAIDAGSSGVQITLKPKKVIIEDDGKGFASEKELEEFFETFAFDHSQHARQIGRFGVGRGQMFHFGKNTWTTNGFRMRVDSKADPYGYDLDAAPKPHKGVKIEIDLYEPLGLADLQKVTTELRALVKYSTLPISLNGKVVSTDPSTLKWDVETPDAWIRLDDSHQIKLYSQGLFVQHLSSYQFGRGGVVITKLGKPLKQNMARNDVLTSDCPVWKRLKTDITKVAAQHTGKAKRTGALNDASRAAMARKIRAGQTHEELAELLEQPLFTLTNGKHVRLATLLDTGYLSTARDNDPKADVLLQRGQASVVTRETLRRWNVESPTELLDVLREALDRLSVHTRHYQSPGYALYTKCRRARDAMKTCQAFDKLTDLPMKANSDLTVLQHKELAKEEQQILSILNRLVNRNGLGYTVAQRVKGKDISWDGHGRTVAMAIRDGAAACTDGHSSIWMERSFVRQCLAKGLPGFHALVNTLVHELVHNIDSTTGHTHDHEFYNAFHDIVLDTKVTNQAIYAYQQWLRLGYKATSSQIREAEKTGIVDEEVAIERMAALEANRGRSAKGGEAAQAQPEPDLALAAREAGDCAPTAAPKPRKRRSP